MLLHFANFLQAWFLIAYRKLAPGIHPLLSFGTRTCIPNQLATQSKPMGRKVSPVLVDLTAQPFAQTGFSHYGKVSNFECWSRLRSFLVAPSVDRGQRPEIGLPSLLGDVWLP